MTASARPVIETRYEQMFYLGFPTGIGGMPLMARAYNQAQKFGAEMAIPDEVVGLLCHRAADGESEIATAHAIINT